MQVKLDLTLLANHVNETDYLWSHEPFKNWIKQIAINNSLMDIYLLVKQNNPWYSPDFIQFKRQLLKCPGYDAFRIDIEQDRLDLMEEDLMLGKVWDEVTKKTKVDQLGNEDIATGYLRLAEKREATMKWFLEKRNKKYQFINTVEDNKGNLSVVIMPKKAEE